MNDKVNKQQLYAIEFLGAEDEPLAYCNVEIFINGYSLSDLPLQADENGRWEFHPSLVEQEGEERLIKVIFWNDQYPKTEHSEVPEFTWVKGKRVVRLRAYNVYEITPRTIPNEKGEPETYKRPYHIVEQGDSWEIIEKEAGVNRYALIWENGLDEATPLSSLVVQKIYFPKGTRAEQPKPHPTQETPTSNEANSKPQRTDSQGQNKEDKEVDSLPKQPPKEGDKEVTKPAEKKKENNKVVQERSANNGKPVDRAPVEHKCFCHRDFTVDEMKNIILEMRTFSKNKQKGLFYEKNCLLSEKDKSFERLTEEINKAFRTWGINTCMRKIQFLAQCYHESAQFSTTLEFASGEYYNPPIVRLRLIQKL